jgi:hypothetical protein
LPAKPCMFIIGPAGKASRLRARLSSNVRPPLVNEAVTRSTWMFVGYAVFAVWGAWGMFRLFPRKMRLLRRYPGATNDDLIRAAKSGDTEAQGLIRDGWRYLAAGVALAALFALVGAMFVVP